MALKKNFKKGHVAMTKTSSVSTSRSTRTTFAAAALITLGVAPISAANSPSRSVAAMPGQDLIVVADAHEYRHCHNFGRKAMCHKKDPLPRNWPPNTNTPHRNNETTKERCPKDSAQCETKSVYEKG